MARSLVLARLEARHARHRDHGRIVGAELDAAGKRLARPARAHAASQPRAQRAVGAHAARHHQCLEPRLLQCAQRLAAPAYRRWRPARRARCRRACAASSVRGCRLRAHRQRHRGLEAGETELEPGRSSMGRGKSKRAARPCSASFASSGPPGYGRPNNLADLSKASPAASSRVSPSICVTPRRRHVDQHGVSAGHQQREVREWRRVRLPAAARAGALRGDEPPRPARARRRPANGRAPHPSTARRSGPGRPCRRRRRS